jgi:hypothetical protein
VKSPVKAGQALQHARFGVGIATSSDPSRTVIDFYDHGVKTFVTDMLEVELIAQAPARPESARPRRKAAAKK